ncbi:hypothetical protein CG709_15605, partial [Lachnotalea glycerini]
LPRSFVFFVAARGAPGSTPLFSWAASGVCRGQFLIRRLIETRKEYLNRLKEYTRKIYICGESNSYSKTNTDATFKCKKTIPPYTDLAKNELCTGSLLTASATAPFLFLYQFI